jgi:serine/threonine protein phosphatase PrpC
MLDVRTLVYSDKGPVKDLNQDNVYWRGHFQQAYQLRSSFHAKARAKDPLQLYALSDGMGGMAKGEIASRLAVQDFESLEYQLNRLPQEQRRSAIDAYIRDRAQFLWDSNRSYDDIHEHMGATLCLLMLEESGALLANIGDSACYHYHEGDLIQLSRDDSHAARLRSLGYITKEEEQHHPFRHVLNNYLGMEYKEDNFSYFCVENIPFSPGDTFLLSSDGINAYVKRTVIREILASANPLEIKADMLIDAALDAGSEDNISLILIEIPAEKEPDGLSQGQSSALSPQEEEQFNRARKEAVIRQNKMRRERLEVRRVPSESASTSNLSSSSTAAQPESLPQTGEDEKLEEYRILSREEKERYYDQRYADKPSRSGKRVQERRPVYRDAQTEAQMEKPVSIKEEKPRRSNPFLAFLSWLLFLAIFTGLGFLLAFLIL